MATQLRIRVPAAWTASLAQRAMGIIAAMSLALGTAQGLAAGDAPAPRAQCPAHAGWQVPDGDALEATTLFDRLSQDQVVLLGERHDSAPHHRWQLDTLQALFARRPALVVGLEMFPRRVQPVLDAWVRGELSEDEFLRRTDWNNAWRFDAALYLEIFRFARDRHIPMQALNVDGALVRAVRRNGFAGVPEGQREGISAPAPASAGYIAWLGGIFSQHAHGFAVKADDARVARFVETQLLWDRAMAQGLQQALAQHPGALVVGLMGSGHLVHGYGVPHQLANLGVRRQATLLPWDRDTDCGELVTGVADAIYMLEPPQPRRHPG
jgi:uncharacterized iron-regulated protein